MTKFQQRYLKDVRDATFARLAACSDRDVRTLDMDDVHEVLDVVKALSKPINSCVRAARAALLACVREVPGSVAMLWVAQLMSMPLFRACPHTGICRPATCTRGWSARLST